MISRRHFLQASSLLSLSPWMPDIFTRTARAVETSTQAPRLVIIQLDGGNDGINTVVPYQDDGYGRARTELRLKADSLLKLDDSVAFHPDMKAAKQLFDDGHLSIIHGVGYPNPNRSHFSSMRIWQSAYLDEARHDEDGWLGRALDTTVSPTSTALETHAIHTSEQELPLALWGKRSIAVSMRKPEELLLKLDPVRTHSEVAAANESLRSFAVRQVDSAFAAADQFAKQTGGSSASNAKYPDNKLGSQLKFISQLIQGQSPTRVFYAVQSGYDTHADQLGQHGRLLREFSEGLKAFLDDLRTAKLDDQVVVLAFSEFGRRVAENDSKGTDHGTAGPVFVAGSSILTGQIGQVPSLSDLEDGDLKSQVDFRQVYATILEQWLKVPSTKILGEPFPSLNLFRTQV